MTTELQQMFSKQVDFQYRVNQLPINISKEDEHRTELIKEHSLVLIDEIMETMRETPWKHWKQPVPIDYEKLKNEIVDQWHFLINITIFSGMDVNELFNRFMEKNKENNQRQEDKY